MNRSRWIVVGGRRTALWTSWAWPGLALALLPKCPACLVAWVGLWTGIGLSIPVASAVRWALAMGCGLGLLLALWLIMGVARGRFAGACDCMLNASQVDSEANTRETLSE